MRLFNLHLRVSAQDMANILKTTPGATVVSLSSHAVVEHREPRKVKVNGSTGRDFTLEFMKKKAAFTSAEIAEAFKKSGRNPKSASPCVSKLKAEGHLHLKNGTYYRKSAKSS